jgi:hypothetical protein
MSWSFAFAALHMGSMAATMELNTGLLQRRWPPRAMIRQNFLESIMADPHQVISITATAVCDLRKDHPDYRMRLNDAFRNLLSFLRIR